MAGQPKCDLIKNYSLAQCARDPVKAVEYLEQFLNAFPDDVYSPHVNYLLAWNYKTIGALDKARDRALWVVNKKERSPEGFENCRFENTATGCIPGLRPLDNFFEEQYNASILLFDIYTSLKKYDSALYILQKAQKEFSFFQRPLPSSRKKDELLKFSLAYENLGDVENSIRVLVPYLLTEPVGDRFMSLLKKYGKLDSVRNASRNIEDFLEIRYGVAVSENPVVIYETAEDGRILRVTSIEEYGRKVIWYFMGEEFLVASANDYQSHRVKGEKGRRQLTPVVSDQQLMSEAVKQVKSFYFYKQLYE